MRDPAIIAEQPKAVYRLEPGERAAFLKAMDMLEAELNSGEADR